MRRTIVSALLISTTLVSLPLTPAHAQQPPAPRPVAPGTRPVAKDAEPTREERTEKARSLLLQGEEKVTAADYAAALELFRASQAVIRSPQASFRIAFCLDQLSLETEAEEAFHRFLGLPPPETMSEERRIAEKRLAALARGKLEITSSPAGAEVQIDGAAHVHAPTEARLAPGKHLITASASGYETATQEVELSARQVLKLAVVLQPIPVTPVIEEHHHTHTTGPAAAPVDRRYAYGAFALGAVSLGIGVVYGFRTLNARSDYAKSPSSELADRQQNSALGCDTALGAAVVFGIVGAVFYAHSGPPDHDHEHAPQHDHEHPHTHAPAAKTSLSVAPLLTRTTQGAAATISF